MLRLIIEKLGSGHDDLFLKIDVMPGSVKVADSYFLADFFEVCDDDRLHIDDDEVVKKKALMLLDYWTDRVKSIEKGAEKFLVFGLSDQCIDGFMLKKVKHGFNIKLVSTDKIFGWGVNKSSLDQQIIDQDVNFHASGIELHEWLIGEEALFQGLAWSKAELAK